MMDHIFWNKRRVKFILFNMLWVPYVLVGFSFYLVAIIMFYHICLIQIVEFKVNLLGEKIKNWKTKKKKNAIPLASILLY